MNFQASFQPFNHTSASLSDRLLSEAEAGLLSEAEASTIQS